MSSSTDTKKLPGTAKLDTKWEDLGFEFRPTNSHVRVTYKDGEWSEPELVQVRIVKGRGMKLSQEEARKGRAKQARLLIPA